MPERMNRRDAARLAAGGTLATLFGARHADARDRYEHAVRAMPAPIIRDVRVIATAPEGLRLVVVRIDTDQDGLYGYGCATFTQRADAVVTAIERYARPFLIGRPADRIEDTWQALYNSSYWRNGPVLNNAISGVDQALWDIKGRQAGMPVYQLLGGKAREGCAAYGHAGGSSIPEAIESLRSWMERGFRHVRVQIGVPGMAGYASSSRGERAFALHDEPVYDPAVYLPIVRSLFQKIREDVGWEIEVLHDVHERVTPIQAVQLCKDLEQFGLFFLEDPVSPEDIAYFRMIRNQCSTPLAMGELFNSPHEWTPLITERLIDFMRMHVSQMGGLTPARKVAILGDHFGVRTAWHGPGDTSPIGFAANVALGISSYNFGVQESHFFNEQAHEVFSNIPEPVDGFLYPVEAPGWGIEVDETAAAKYPFGYRESGQKERLNGGWGVIRRPDGTVIKQ